MAASRLCRHVLLLVTSSYLSFGILVIIVLMSIQNSLQGCCPVIICSSQIVILGTSGVNELAFAYVLIPLTLRRFRTDLATGNL